METQLSALWVDGLTCSQIAATLTLQFERSITTSAVIGKAHRLHLSPRPNPIKRYPGQLPQRPYSGRPQRQIHAALIMPKPKVVKMEPPPELPKAPDTRLIGKQRCKWPHGDPKSKDFHFCSERAIAGKPYCPTHYDTAYIKVPAKKAEAA